MQKLKHITVNQEVYQKLKNPGKAGDSFNDVLSRLLKNQSIIEKTDFQTKKGE